MRRTRTRTSASWSWVTYQFWHWDEHSHFIHSVGNIFWKAISGIMFGTYQELQEQEQLGNPPTHKSAPLIGSCHSGTDSILIGHVSFLLIYRVVFFCKSGSPKPLSFLWVASFMHFIILFHFASCMIVTGRRQLTIRRIYLFLYFPSFVACFCHWDWMQITMIIYALNWCRILDSILSRCKLEGRIFNILPILRKYYMQ